jgi:hypothetical protein
MLISDISTHPAPFFQPYQRLFCNCNIVGILMAMQNNMAKPIMIIALGIIRSEMTLAPAAFTALESGQG